MTSNSKLHHTIMLWMGECAETLSGDPFLLRADGIGLWDVRGFEQASRLGHHLCGKGLFPKCDQVLTVQRLDQMRPFHILLEEMGLDKVGRPWICDS